MIIFTVIGIVVSTLALAGALIATVCYVGVRIIDHDEIQRRALEREGRHAEIC